MFPFIWWLGEPPAPPVDAGSHEGGGDFLRRRVIMATSAMARKTGTPASAVAWYYAQAAYIDTDANGLVTAWRDRGPRGYHLSASVEAERPTWEAAGWSATKSSVQFPGAKNVGMTAPLGTLFNGSDVPYWVVATVQVTDLTTDRTIVAWDDGATAQSKHYIADTSGFAALTRTDDGASSATASAAAGGTGTGHRRLGWSFAGTTVNAWVDLQQVMSATACNVGTCSFTRLRIGEGLGATDSLVGRVAEVVIGTGTLSQADWLRYYYYSLGEWA